MSGLKDIHERLASKLPSKPLTDEEKLRLYVAEQNREQIRQKMIKFNASRIAQEEAAEELAGNPEPASRPRPQISYPEHLYRLSKSAERYYSGEV